ncbi:MAG: hypothetical protein FWD22_02205 [Treponema sp.]|nr:hypothetical protein [Treponema sp.]
MAIAPIDLQTIFTQVDKVGKTQAAQKEGQALQQSIQGSEIQRKTEEQIKQVNETQNTGEGVDKVKDRNSSSGQKQNNRGKNDESENDELNDSESKTSVLRNPCLGNKIDISL